MKIIEYSDFGNPADVLTVKDVPSVQLKTGEIRVKVLATPIHPSSLLQISGQYGTTAALPSTPGAEGIGQVTEVASDVANMTVGQRVMLGAGSGTWCQEMVGPTAGFIPLPDMGDVEQLSMLSINPLTALLLLTKFTDLKEGDWVVQSAANSAVGEYLIQIAKQRGIKTVNIVRRESLVAGLEKLGADVVIIDGPDLSDRIKQATGGAPISLAADCVGGDTLTALISSLGYGATAVSYGLLSGKPASLDPAICIFNEITVHGFWLQKWFEMSSQDEKQDAFGQIIPAIVSGAIKTNVDSCFSLDEIKQAVTRAAENGRDGKVLLTPNAE